MPRTVPSPCRPPGLIDTPSSRTVPRGPRTSATVSQGPALSPPASTSRSARTSWSASTSRSTARSSVTGPTRTAFAPDSRAAATRACASASCTVPSRNRRPASTSSSPTVTTTTRGAGRTHRRPRHLAYAAAIGRGPSRSPAVSTTCPAAASQPAGRTPSPGRTPPRIATFARPRSVSSSATTASAVAVEDTGRGRANVAIRGGVRPGDGVRPAGCDAAAGQVVLTAGLRLGSRHLAYAAAIGRGRLWVRPAPRVVVVTVGDELVDAGRRLRDGTGHDADAHALVAAARESGANAVRVGPVTDDRAVLREVLADQLVRADLLVLAGGLSAGPWDTVADVLGPLGTVRLDGVSMSPGGRQGLGTVRGMTPGELDDVGEDDRPGALVVALPGHPVAALLSFEMFVRPAVRKMAGYTELFRPSVRATAARRWGSPAGMTQLVPGTVIGSPAHGY